MTQTAEHVYTPSELNREVRLHLEAGFPRLSVEAEISNLSRPPSGHLYFSLKDSKAQIRCALFRSAAARLAIRPENGMKVVARGRIGLYEPRGEYQMIVDGLRDAGEGELQRRFEELKKKLEAEGLFDPARKKELPAFPGRIAIVTSPRGAAIRDLLQVFGRRWPAAAIRLYPALVQGETAPLEVRRAIEAANRHAWADLLIVGRGGGSLEDLAAFNDELVARAVSDSVLPVISAVGHETDYSICDFVADLRAPTPSAAAELAVPDQAVLKQSFRRLERQLERRAGDRMHREMQRLDHLSHRLRQRHPANRLADQARQLESAGTALHRVIERQLDDRARKLDHLERRLAAYQPGRRLEALESRVRSIRGALERVFAATLAARRQQVRDLARTLNAVSPLETIGRGYAVLAEDRTGRVISSVSQADPGDAVTAQLGDGRLHCTVNSSSDETLDPVES